MNKARMIVLGVAALSAGLAAMMLLDRKAPVPQQVVATQPQSTTTVDVMVAGGEFQSGHVLKASDLRWQPWPKESASDKLVRKDISPNAIEETAGAMVRYPMVQGEPVRLPRLVRAGGKGYMAAMLTPGMRGFSIEVTAESSAAGFIMPNDQVDVLLTRRLTDMTNIANSNKTHETQTILQSVRVLAVDAATEDPNSNAKNMPGRVVTVELTLAQAEQLAMARQSGTLSLALRAVADAGSMPLSGTDDNAKPTGTITVIRFGRPSSAQ